MNPQKKIMILAEYSEESLMPITMELIRCAKEIGQHIPVRIQAVLIGEHLTIPCEHIADSGTEVISVTAGGINHSHPTVYRSFIEALVEDHRPDILIAGHTSFGTDLLPGLAVSIGASCITGVKRIVCESDELRFVRSIWNGKFDSVIRSERTMTAITVLPGAFKPVPSDGEKKGNIIRITGTAKSDEDRIRLETITRIASSSDFSFDDAEVIVAAGRGIGKEEHLDIIRKFAELFRRSAVAGSRPLIDCGWLPYRQQVGITGKTVAPKVYIACGISGSSQHIAGMSGSEFVISVNTDPDAAIFNISDVCIVENLIPFLEEVMRDERMIVKRRES